MINNNPYNIPQKKPLSQSKIFSDINNSRHSSTHMQNRPSNDVMYNSSIFMKNSAIMNHQSELSFFQPIREPLSPHSKYTKQPQSVQFIPPYTNNNINIVPMRAPQNNYYPVNSPKDLNFERTLNDLKQKIESLQKKVQMQDKDRKNTPINDPSNKKSTFPSEVDSLIVKIQDSVINSDKLKQVISSIFESHFESHTKPIWQKVKDLDESMGYSTNGASSEKLSRLQESFLRSQSQKLHEQQFMSRIKTIQKTIREMGEDIHLVNDKEEGLSIKIENELPWLRNEIKSMKVMQKKLTQSETRNSQLKQQIDQLVKKIKSIESTIQTNIMGKIKQFQLKINNFDNKEPNISRSFDKYPSQPIVLKYLEKFQISKSTLNKNNMVNSRQKQIVEDITINEMTYYIDQDGYLLDKDSYYLINSQKGERVRLSPAHIQLLRQKSILI